MLEEDTGEGNVRPGTKLERDNEDDDDWEDDDDDSGHGG